MTIEFIYTFEYTPQQFKSYPFVLPILESKEVLIEFATTMLTKLEKEDLIKISCCVYKDPESGKLNEPDWYRKCKGKLWFNQ